MAKALILQIDSIQSTDVLDQLVGDVGYIRNYSRFTSSHSVRLDCRLTQLAARVTDQGVDKKNTHQLLNEYPEQIFCDPFQDSRFQADGFPRLKAGSCSQIIAQYLENGNTSTPVSSASVVGDICWFGTGGSAAEAGYRAKSSCIAYPVLCKWWIGVRTTACTASQCAH